MKKWGITKTVLVVVGVTMIPVIIARMWGENFDEILRHVAAVGSAGIFAVGAFELGDYFKTKKQGRTYRIVESQRIGIQRQVAKWCGGVVVVALIVIAYRTYREKPTPEQMSRPSRDSASLPATSAPARPIPTYTPISTSNVPTPSYYSLMPFNEVYEYKKGYVDGHAAGYQAGLKNGEYGVAAERVKVAEIERKTEELAIRKAEEDRKMVEQRMKANETRNSEIFYDRLWLAGKIVLGLIVAGFLFAIGYVATNRAARSKEAEVQRKKEVRWKAEAESKKAQENREAKDVEARTQQEKRWAREAEAKTADAPRLRAEAEAKKAQAEGKALEEKRVLEQAELKKREEQRLIEEAKVRQAVIQAEIEKAKAVQAQRDIEAGQIKQWEEQSRVKEMEAKKAQEERLKAEVLARQAEASARMAEEERKKEDARLAALELEKQNNLESYPLLHHADVFFRRLEELPALEMKGNREGKLFELHLKIKETLTKNGKTTIEQKESVADDALRLHQVEALLDIYSEKIKNVRDDKALDDEEKDDKIAYWKSLRDKHVSDIQGA